jgi:hypothetical protein
LDFDYIKGLEDRWQKVYKLLKERFPMIYTIISTILILKPPLFMWKAKVSGHAVWGVSILPLIVATQNVIKNQLDNYCILTNVLTRKTTLYFVRKCLIEHSEYMFIYLEGKYNSLKGN